jgi:hypothetical protein
MPDLADMLMNSNAYRAATDDLARAVGINADELATIIMAISGQHPPQARQTLIKLLRQSAARDDAALRQPPPLPKPPPRQPPKPKPRPRPRKERLPFLGGGVAQAWRRRV